VRFSQQGRTGNSRHNRHLGRNADICGDPERAAIKAAAARLLAGTPLHTTSGRLTATELTFEAGLRRDVLYEHHDLLDDFKAQARLRRHVPDAM
jgi:hypothetical protein